MSAKRPTAEQGIPRTLWGFLSTLGCDLKSQEMSLGPDHATFPAHPRMGLLLSSFLAEVTPPLSPSSHTHTLLQLLQRCVCFSPVTSHPGRSSSVFVPAPVCKAFHCPRPFLLSCPHHAYPQEAGKWCGRLRSGFTSLLSPFTACPLAHKQTLGFSSGTPCLCFSRFP